MERCALMHGTSIMAEKRHGVGQREYLSLIVWGRVFVNWSHGSIVGILSPKVS